MLAIEKVDYEKVKAACIALNEALETPFQVVGAAKDVLVSQFVETVEQLSKEDKKVLPDEVIEFYNDLFADEALETEAPEGEEAAEAPATGEEEVKEEEVKEEEVKDEKKTKDTPKKPKKKGLVGVRAYNSFEELTKIIEKDSTPTTHMDLLMLKGGKLLDIHQEFQDYVNERKLTIKTFSNSSSLKAHIKYRSERGWIFELEGKDKEETVKLVGFKDPKAK